MYGPNSSGVLSFTSKGEHTASHNPYMYFEVTDSTHLTPSYTLDLIGPAAQEKLSKHWWWQTSFFSADSDP